MSDLMDRYYRHDVRYLIKEFYFGSGEHEFTCCACLGLFDCKLIVDALVKSHSGRPFTYRVVKVVDDFNPTYDELTWVNHLTGEVVELSSYLDGICALDYKEGV